MSQTSLEGGDATDGGLACVEEKISEALKSEKGAISNFTADRNNKRGGKRCTGPMVYICEDMYFS